MNKNKLIIKIKNKPKQQHLDEILRSYYAHLQQLDLYFASLVYASLASQELQFEIIDKVLRSISQEDFERFVNYSKVLKFNIFDILIRTLNDCSQEKIMASKFERMILSCVELNGTTASLKLILSYIIGKLSNSSTC